jgi:hypothetical protein
MAKGKGGNKTKKEVVRKVKGEKPDYKIPRMGKDVLNGIFALDLEHARARLIAAPKKDKWIYEIEYQVLKQEKHNGGMLLFLHNSGSIKKTTYI